MGLLLVDCTGTGEQIAFCVETLHSLHCAAVAAMVVKVCQHLEKVTLMWCNLAVSLLRFGMRFTLGLSSNSENRLQGVILITRTS